MGLSGDIILKEKSENAPFPFAGLTVVVMLACFLDSRSSYPSALVIASSSLRIPWPSRPRDPLRRPHMTVNELYLRAFPVAVLMPEHRGQRPLHV